MLVDTIMVSPDGAPRFYCIESSAEVLRTLLGGRVSSVNILPHIVALYYFDAFPRCILHNRIINNVIIPGTFLLCGVDEKNHLRSLTLQEQRECMKYL